MKNKILQLALFSIFAIAYITLGLAFTKILKLFLGGLI